MDKGLITRLRYTGMGFRLALIGTFFKQSQAWEAILAAVDARARAAGIEGPLLRRWPRNPEST
jgi:hypothetical protein